MNNQESTIPKGTSFKFAKELFDAGLTKRSADMIILRPAFAVDGDLIPKEFERIYRQEKGYSIDEIDAWPAWSLAALINLLPKSIYEENEDPELAELGCDIGYDLVMEKDYIAFRTCDGEKTMFEFYGDNLLECVVRMVLQLLKEGWTESDLLDSNIDDV